MQLLDILNNYYIVPDILDDDDNAMISVTNIDISEDVQVPDNILEYRLIYISNVSEDNDVNINNIEFIISKMPHGSRMFIDKLDDDTMHKIYSDINGDTRIVVVQHIIGVGYIVSVTSRAIKKWFEYTEERYVQLSEQYIVCGIAKQERDYIKDWVKYHLDIGFDRIYLYDNNDPDGESYGSLLDEYIKNDQLEIIDVRGIPGQQLNSYLTTYYGIPFTYVAFIDIDEFITIDSSYTDIKDYITKTDKPELKSTGIVLQWHCFAGSDNTDNSIPIYERNLNKIPPRMKKDSRSEFINGWSKSIIHRGHNIDMNEHYPWIYTPDNGVAKRFVDWEGNIRYDINIYINNFDEQDKQTAYVRHYILRSIQNVYYNKYLRGHAGLDHEDDGMDGWHWWGWYHNMNYYTDVTPVLTEKEQLFMRSRGMKVNYTFRPDCVLVLNKYINDPTYNDFISWLLVDMQNNCNMTQFHILYDSENSIHQPDYNQQCNIKSGYDFSFLNSDYTSYVGAGIPFYMPKTSICSNAGLQEPIVISIGFPLSHMTQEISVDALKEEMEDMSSFFNIKNFRMMLRSIIEDPSKTYTSKRFVGDVGDMAGWLDIMKEFLGTLNMEIPEYKLSNNTFITSLSQYKKYIQYQEKFQSRFPSVYNDFIVNNTLANYSTPYDAFVHTQLSVFDNITYMD